jgi:hypothetical protein
MSIPAWNELPPLRQFCQKLADYDHHVAVVMMYNTSSSDKDDEFIMMIGKSDHNGELAMQRRQIKHCCVKALKSSCNESPTF